MEMPFGGTVSCDDFTSGTISAAFGGTTTQVDFCFQAPGQSLPDALATWHEKIERAKPVIDVGFHLAVTDLKRAGRSRTSRRRRTRGSRATSSSWPTRARSWSTTRRFSRRCRSRPRRERLVMVHAENGDAIDVLVKQALAEGKTEPKWHAAHARRLRRARRRTGLYSSRASPAPRSTSSTSPARRPSTRSRRRARTTGTPGARLALSTSSSTRRH